MRTNAFAFVVTRNTPSTSALLRAAILFSLSCAGDIHRDVHDDAFTFGDVDFARHRGRTRVREGDEVHPGRERDGTAHRGRSDVLSVNGDLGPWRREDPKIAVGQVRGKRERTLD